MISGGGSFTPSNISALNHNFTDLYQGLWGYPAQWEGAGDGQADDTAAIRRAIQAAGVGGTVVFPAGQTCIVSGHLAPLARQTWWGYGATLKRCDQVMSTTATAIAAGQSAVSVTVASVSGFRKGMDVTVYNGAEFDPVNHEILAIIGRTLLLSTVFTVAFPNGGTVVSSLSVIDGGASTPAKVAILGLTIDGNKANNTLLTRWENHKDIRLTSDGGVIRDCVIQNSQADGCVVGGDGFLIAHNRIVECNGNGVHLSGASGARIDGNWIENTNLGGAGVGHADGCLTLSDLVADTRILGNTLIHGISGIGSIDADDNSGVVIQGNVIRDCATYGLEMILPDVSSGKVIIDGNQFYNCGPISLYNSDSTPTANTGPYRVQLTNNYLETTKLDIRRAFDISVIGNQLASPADTTNIAVYLYNVKRCLVSGNQVRGFNYGCYIDGTAGQVPESLSVQGNVFTNQTTGAVRFNIAGSIGLSVQQNMIQTDAGYAAAGYSAIWPSNGVSVIGNVLHLLSGQFGILCPNGAADTQGAIVAGNVIRSAVTASIRTAGGSQKNVIVGNYVQQAISDGGDPNNTVSGTVTIL